MGFFLCGRLKRSQKLTASSPLSYQLVPPESHPSRDELPQGDSCSVENLPAPAENENEKQHSSNGWPSRLRRRLSSSIDSKGLHPISISKRADRHTGMASLFPSSKTSGAGPVVSGSGDVGNSLMSEKGYDSDAQFITTPKQNIPITEPPLAASGIGSDMSPLRNSYHPEEIDDVSGQLERSVKQVGDMTDGLHLGQGIHGSQLTVAFPTLICCPQPDLTSETDRVSSPLGNPTGLSDRDADPEGPASMSEGPAGTGHGITTPPRSINGGTGRFYANVAQYGLQYACQPMQAAHVSNGKSSESSIEGNSEITVPKRRQQHSRDSSSAVPSIHLGDLDISKALGSQSTSPRILSQNPSIEEKGQVNWYRARSVSDQYHDCQRGASTPSWGGNGLNFPIAHKRDVSSFYSPKSSVSSIGMSTDHRFRDLKRNASSPLGSRGPLVTENARAPQQDTDLNAMVDPNAASNGFEPQNDSQKSKFVEEFGIQQPVGFARSISNGTTDPNEDLPPRKVSVGWMSGGRRVGYGYTLVADDEDGNQQSQIESNTLSGSEKDGANGEKVESKVQDSDEQSVGQNNRVSSTSTSAEPTSSNSDPPDRGNRPAFRRWSEAAALTRPTRTSESTDEGSVASSLWESFTGRRNDRNDQWKKTDQLPEEHCPKRSIRFEDEDRGLLARRIGMCFPPNIGTDQSNAAAEERESMAQTGPNGSQFDSLPKKRSRVKFRVLDRAKRRNNRSSADRHPVFPVKRSLWMRDSGLIFREGLEGESTVRFSAPEPDWYGSKRSRRSRPNGVEDDWVGTDQNCLEVHSNPE